MIIMVIQVSSCRRLNGSIRLWKRFTDVFNPPRSSSQMGEFARESAHTPQPLSSTAIPKTSLLKLSSFRANLTHPRSSIRLPSTPDNAGSSVGQAGMTPLQLPPTPPSSRRTYPVKLRRVALSSTRTKLVGLKQVMRRSLRLDRTVFTGETTQKRRGILYESKPAVMESIQAHRRERIVIAIVYQNSRWTTFISQQALPELITQLSGSRGSTARGAYHQLLQGAKSLLCLGELGTSGGDWDG